MTQLLTTDTTSPEVDRAIATLVTAFSADPVIRWLYPHAADYLAHFPGFVRRFSGEAFARGSAERDGDVGIAAWLAPDTVLDEEGLGQYISETVDESKLEIVQTTFERLDACRPDEPYWYLTLLGVDPAYQGQGRGAALLTQGLKRCDESGRPSYLESSNVRNLPLYERHGFEVIEEIRNGDAPPLWPMLRRPR
jgi:ribosomal protein S18 acetylase RimI-like enzyme